MTIVGPEPKPIWTGTTAIHFLYITHGPLVLRTYKILERVHGGRSDDDLETTEIQNTIILLRWANLY